MPRVDFREVFNPYADDGLEDAHGDGICEGALHDKLDGWRGARVSCQGPMLE